MDIDGEYRIPVARDKIWEALNDPEVLKLCIPGCKELSQDAPGEMSAKVALKVGPVSATFSGSVKFEDVNAPNGYTLVGHGNGGMAGFAKGRAVVNLVEEGPETLLRYEAKAETGGKIASLGGRLLQSTSRKLADQFFGAFANYLGDHPVGRADPTSQAV
ncbi:carbon monoxide dehydrogenase subunit G [Methylobacterium sp. C25]|uniref:CoxG family protein n=1 Tax=Methylobacterium sp. C25 TaxID=2721622 RepID=UPI001F2DCDCD|nr:carbon monoxide dehydrogenase subunit G [Methylobacterium sp. C25]MCE4226245.1 carbon monoxide dehydrogenase subunit G [Methylobacterium sp. C25]